jgi:hypothetical protein
MTRYKLGKYKGGKDAAIRIAKDNNGWFEIEYDGKTRPIYTCQIRKFVKTGELEGDD